MTESDRPAEALGPDRLAEVFERNRVRLRAVAHRMLGSFTEADDAVQEAWLRLTRSDTGRVASLDAWLTTIVVRVCLTMLRARSSRREELTGMQVPDPVVSRTDGMNPEDAALLADAVGLALQVVLAALAPAERLAFVLHDMFDLPFDEIAPMVGRSPATARQLASRARRRVRGSGVPAPDPDAAGRREVVDAFFAAARRGELRALIAVLGPRGVLCADEGAAHREGAAVAHGAAVSGRAPGFEQPAARVCPALVKPAAGAVVTVGGRPVPAEGFTVARGRIVRIGVMAGPERLARLGPCALDRPVT